MTDERDAYDEDLAALMRRSDGPVAVRPLRIPAARRRIAPSLLATGALVIALIIAGNALAGQREKDRPAATATAALPSGPTGTPAATASTMSLDPARALVVNLGGHGIGVRTETDPTVFFRVDNRTQYAVGPKGQLAYWKTGPDDALPHELHVFDLATRADRTLLTLTDERAGAAGFMVWSTDGTGLAFATHSAASAFEGRQAPARPQLSKWNLLDVATGVERTIGSINGAWLVPLSWNRSTGLATAAELERDSSGVTSTYYAYSDAARGMIQLPLPAQMEPRGIYVTSDGDTALGLVRTPCSGTPTCPPPVLWTWSLDDPYQAQSRSISSGTVLTAAFRPGTRDVYVLHKISDGRTQLESWGDRGSATPREVLAMTTAQYFFAFREDGSAVFLLAATEQRLPGNMVDPDGRSTAIPLATPDDVVATLGGTPARASTRSARLPSGLLYGTNDGRLFFALANGSPTGPSGKVCDGVITKIATQLGSTAAVIVCQLNGETYTRGFLVDLGSLVTPSVRKVTPLPGMMSNNVALSPDARSIIYTTIGDCEPPAPICKMRLVTLEIGQGRVGTPVDVMPQEYNLGEVRWTALGPSVFKPQRSPNGIRPPETAGTYLYDGGTWQRYSLHRLVDAIPGVATVLEIEGGDGVVRRTGSREDRVSPDGAHESVLALLDDGRILAWRAGSNAFDGSIVTYRGAGAGSEDPGRFSSWNVLRGGPLSGVLLGLELSGAPSLTLNVYSIADHTFSAVPAGGASAVGALTATFAHR